MEEPSHRLHAEALVRFGLRAAMRSEQAWHDQLEPVAARHAAEGNLAAWERRPLDLDPPADVEAAQFEASPEEHGQDKRQEPELAGDFAAWAWAWASVARGALAVPFVLQPARRVTDLG